MVCCSTATWTLAASGGTDFYFPLPEWGEVDNGISKQVVVFNMWDNDDIEVVDKGIDNQPLTIGGTICVCGDWSGLCFPICFPACFSRPLYLQIKNLHTAMNNGEYFTINELGDCVNGVYVITDFRFDTIPKCNYCYKWQLTLERKRSL